MSVSEELLSLAATLDEYAKKALEPHTTMQSWPHAKSASPGVVQLAYGMKAIATSLRSLAESEAPNV